MQAMNLQCSCGHKVTQVSPIRQLTKLPDGGDNWQNAGFIGTCGNGCTPVVVTTEPAAKFPEGILVINEKPPKPVEWIVLGSDDHYFLTGF